MSALRTIAFVALALIVAIVVLVWRFPASAALALMPAQTMSQLSRFVALHDVNGTLWNGDARFTTMATPATQQLAWRCAPSLANLVNLALDCELSGAALGRVRAQPFANRIAIESLQLQQSVSIAPNANFAFVTDNLALSIANATADRSAVAATANASARDASYRIGNNTIELGEVFIDCKPASDNATTNCTIKNRASAARLDGTLTLSAQRASGSVEFTPPGAATQRVTF